MSLREYISYFLRAIVSFNFLRKHDENEKRYLKKIKDFTFFKKSKKIAASKNYVLVQVVKDYEFALILPITAWVLANKQNYNIGLWVVRSKVESIYNINKYKQLVNHITFNKISDKRWVDLFSVFGGTVIFRNTEKHKNQKIVQSLTEQLFSNLKTKEDVLKIEIRSILVGDLIYDFYLRMANKPTIDIKDPFLKYIIEQTINISFSAKELFDSKQISTVLTTYTTYIQHGIVAREALNRGVDVYALANAKKFAIKVSKEFSSHSQNHSNYKNEFEQLSDKEKRIAEAKESFEKRFTGEIDSALFYMRGTGFSKYTTDSPRLFTQSGKKRIVIFLHCFFDSPHIYRTMLFPDFYEWLKFTLEKATALSNIDFYVKPHPNALPGNDEIVNEFKKQFPAIHFFDKSISNNQLIDEGFDAAITVYGTLGHEYPYRGIPVINAGDNPHSSFNFCYNPTSINEYETLLKKVDTLKVNEDAKTEILKFYYMHNLYTTGGAEKDILSIKDIKGTGDDSKLLVDFINLHINKQKSLEEKLQTTEANFN